MEKNEKGIVLVKCSAEISSMEFISGIKAESVITDSFELLFRDLDGEAFFESVCEKVQSDMFSDITNLAKSIIEVIDNEAAEPIGDKVVIVETEMYLTEENEIWLATADNVKEVYEGPDKERLCYMVEGIRKAYEYHQGVPTMFTWDDYIHMAFNEPEKFIEKFKADKDGE